MASVQQKGRGNNQEKRKSVGSDLGVATSTELADNIVNYFRNATHGWEKLPDNTAAYSTVIRMEELAKERADASALVLGGITPQKLVTPMGMWPS